MAQRPPFDAIEKKVTKEKATGKNAIRA